MKPKTPKTPGTPEAARGRPRSTLRIEKRLSPEEMAAWWAKQAQNLPKDEILELADWVTLALGASPKVKKTLKDTIMKGDTVAMKTGIELWAEAFIDEHRREGILVGRREGMREGERKKSFEIAAKLRAKGTSVEETAEATGLTVDEILQM